MELRQLEYFVAVAEEGGFTRAAERVHISQSGVSAQVKALERELGAELFERSSRIARLTTAGAAALPHARRALDAATALRQSVDDVTGLLRGRLTAGMVTGCEVTPWFAALAAFHQEHPGIDIDLREDNSDRLVAGVLAGTVDIALVGTAGEPPRELASDVIVSEGLSAVVPPDHPLARNAGGRAVTPAELTAYPLVCLPEGTGVRTVLDRSCAAAGLRPTIVLAASAPGAVVDLGRRGLGVAVLSDSMAAAYPGLRAVPIDGITVPAVLALVRRPKPTPATAALLTHCRQTFADGTRPTAAGRDPGRKHAAAGRSLDQPATAADPRQAIPTADATTPDRYRE
jgi:DNA-binding transcriptional LysR family regulator